MSKWKWKKLGEVCEIHGRIGWQGLTRKEYRSSGDYLLITGINFTDNNTVDYESCVYVDKERYVQDQYIQVRENDLLITKDGTLGKLALIAEMPPKPATLNGGLFVIRNPDNKIYPKFLMYVMKSEPFRKMIRKSITGSTVPHLTQNMLVNFPIPIPSLSEQRSIVKQVDEKLTKIEKIKTNAETNLKNAKELFETTLEKELNPPSRHSERSEESSADLPSGWEWKALDEFSTNLDAKRKPVTKKNRVNGNYPYYGASGIVDYVDSYIYDGKYLLISEDGANLVARSTPIAFIAEGKFWVNNHAHIIETANEATLQYLVYFFENLDLSPYVKGMAQPKLSQDSLYKIPIPLPPLSVQKEIVARLDKLSENVKRLEANYKQIIANCDELKKSILKKTFEGDSRSSRE